MLGISVHYFSTVKDLKNINIFTRTLCWALELLSHNFELSFFQTIHDEKLLYFPTWPWIFRWKHLQDWFFTLLQYLETHFSLLGPTDHLVRTMSSAWILGLVRSCSDLFEENISLDFREITFWSGCSIPTRWTPQRYFIKLPAMMGLGNFSDKQEESSFFQLKLFLKFLF